MALGDKTSYPQCTLLKSTHDGDVVIYSLEIHNRPDNRLTPDLLRNSLLPALDAVENDWRESMQNGGGNAALITYGPSDAHRFYSNGLDLALATTTPSFWPRMFNPLFVKLLTFPIPTIAAINGHAFAGGMTMALAHDYRIMKGLDSADKRKGCMMAMNEIEFGAAIPPGMLAVLKAKIPAISTLRSVLLEGKRFDGPQALKANLVDALAEDGPAVVDSAMQLAKSLAPRALPGAWGVIKAGMYESALRDLAADKGADGTGASVVANLQRMAKKATAGQNKQAKL